MDPISSLVTILVVVYMRHGNVLWDVFLSVVVWAELKNQCNDLNVYKSVALLC